MPGIKDSIHSGDFITDFALYREVTADDTDVSLIQEEIDLSNSASAVLNNRIAVVVRGTDVTATLYVIPASGDLADVAIKAKTESLSKDTLYVFDNLYAGIYKIHITGTQGTPVSVYIAHTDIPKFG